VDRALARFRRHGMDVEAARTRLDLALALRAVDRHAAIGEARAAIAELHNVGATHERDAASALLRELGDDSRPVAARAMEELTARELEVLALISEGLTNADIAERLFISVKTAGNHVSHILMKLGARNRSHAATLARSAQR
jgi:DNA-binding NarL/FixJ family response regulator